MKQTGKEFIYQSSIKWQTQRKGVISSQGKPDIAVATPPEFKGHPGIWTPEDFFITAVNSCIMTTFLYYAEKGRLNFLSYHSDVEGVLEKIDNQFMFSRVTVKPYIVVTNNSDINKAKNLIGLSGKDCLISHSIKSKVEIMPVISAR